LFLARLILSSLLAAALIYTAVRKLTHAPKVVAEYARAGVPERWLTTLALLLIAAALGLVAGIAWVPLGAMTAWALVAYFGVAIGFHFRHADAQHAGTPAVLGAMAVAIGVLSSWAELAG